jgi:septum site-determining protein MinC
MSTDLIGSAGPTPAGSRNVGDSGASAQACRLGLAFAQGVPVLVLDESANIEGLRASIRVHLPAHQPQIAGRSVRLDLGAREINLFDLRRIVHLLKQEYGLEVTGLYVRGGVIHRFAERELKLKLFPNDPAPRVGDAPAPPREALPVEPIEEVPTEELDVSDEGEIPPAVLAPAPVVAESRARPAPPPSATAANVLAKVTLPHDLHPDDLPRQRTIATPVAPPSGSTTGGSTPPPTRSQTVHRTLRSGTVIRFDGDVTVFGDVNPGAQIVASGNVVVLGALKGQVHAGCEGDPKAFVLALDLQPTQVRIGTHIAQFDARRTAGGTRIAVVRDEAIAIEPYPLGSSPKPNARRR